MIFRDSSIRAWDLEGLCCKRTLNGVCVCGVCVCVCVCSNCPLSLGVLMKGHSGDVLSLVVAGPMLFRYTISILSFFSLLSFVNCIIALLLTFPSLPVCSGGADGLILAWSCETLAMVNLI